MNKRLEKETDLLSNKCVIGMLELLYGEGSKN